VGHHVEIGFCSANRHLEARFKYVPSDEDYKEHTCIMLKREQDIAHVAVLPWVVARCESYVHAIESMEQDRQINNENLQENNERKIRHKVGCSVKCLNTLCCEVVDD